MNFNITGGGAGEPAEVQIGSISASVESAHFRSLKDHQDRKRLFASSVRSVVVELTSYCNRRCQFCPNTEGTRLSPRRQSVLSETAFGRLLDGLAEIAYSGRVLWHLYNEPLAAPDILLPRMRRARQLLPSARFVLNSNGDYLDRSTLEALEESGLNALTVSIYGPDHGRWDDDYVRERVLAVGHALGLGGRLVESPGSSFSMAGKLRGLSVNVAARNLWKTGYDRGGLVPALAAPRSSPCLAPFAEFLVDHRGFVLPCCNVYTDRPEHLPHTIGNLNESDIFELYSGVRAQAWRRGVLAFDPGGSLCEGCSRGNVPEIDTEANRLRLRDLVKEMID